MEHTQEVDRLAEATGGKLHWDDPGMNELEKGHEEFTLGIRVEVRTANDTWQKGTVVETIRENDRGITVECDEKWHDNLEFLNGHGATVMVYMNTRRGILSRIRKIDEPRREVVIPRHDPAQLEGNKAELLAIAEAAVQNSNGRLRIAFNEEDETEDFVGSAARFIKFDGKRIGRDIELYGFMGSGPVGWEGTLAMFLEEVLLPIKSLDLIESYNAAAEKLKELGHKVYPANLLADWDGLF